TPAPRFFGSPVPAPRPSANGMHVGSSRSICPSPLSSTQLSQISTQAGSLLHTASPQSTAFVVTTQVPVVTSHVPDSWQGSSDEQSRGAPAVHAPLPSHASS